VRTAFHVVSAHVLRICVLAAADAVEASRDELCRLTPAPETAITA
jgi:hypothetical protein